VVFADIKIVGENGITQLLTGVTTVNFSATRNFRPLGYFLKA